MLKKVLMSIVIIAILTSCTSATANKDTATYFESVDNQSNSFEIIKLVDKETGCKYLLINDSGSYSGQAIVQMRDKNDKPLCK
jgi:uncharacterized membrane protein